MQECLLKFVEWTKLKVRLHFSKEKPVYFREKEIWWASLGINIGYEQDGKNKTWMYYYQFKYRGVEYSIILSQIRLISSKRLFRKLRVFPDLEFEKVKELVKALI